VPFKMIWVIFSICWGILSGFIGFSGRYRSCLALFAFSGKGTMRTDTVLPFLPFFLVMDSKNWYCLDFFRFWFCLSVFSCPPFCCWRWDFANYWVIDRLVLVSSVFSVLPTDVAFFDYWDRLMTCSDTIKRNYNGCKVILIDRFYELETVTYIYCYQKIYIYKWY
jgi:hypothetical protein